MDSDPFSNRKISTCSTNASSYSVASSVAASRKGVFSTSNTKRVNSTHLRNHQFSTSTIASSKGEPNFLVKVWSFVTGKIVSFFEWALSFLPWFGDHKIDFLKEILDNPEAQAIEFVKDLKKNLGDLFEAFLENPKVAEKLISEKPTQYAKFTAKLKEEMKKTNDAQNIPDYDYLNINSIYYLFSNQDLMQKVMVQTSLDIAKAIKPKKGETPDPNTVKSLKTFFTQTLPKYFEFGSKKEFEAFFSNAENSNNIIACLKNYTPGRVKDEMEKMDTALLEALFKGPHILKLAPLPFKLKHRFGGNLIAELKEEDWKQIEKNVKGFIPELVLSKIKEIASTEKGKNRLRENFIPYSADIWSKFIKEIK